MHPSLYFFTLGILIVSSLGLPAPYTVEPGDRPYVGIIPFRRSVALGQARDSRPKDSVWHHLARRTGIKRQDKPAPMTVNMIPMHVLDAAAPTLAPAPTVAAAQAIVPAPTAISVNTVDDLSHVPQSAHVVFNAGPDPTPIVPPQAIPTAHNASAAAPHVSSPKHEQMEPNSESSAPDLHKKKVALIAGVFGVIFGLLIFVALAKLCKDAVSRRRFSYAADTGSSQDGLIRCCGPSKDEMRQAAKHNVVLTRPDGSEVSHSLSDSTAETVDHGPMTPWTSPKGPPPSAAPLYPPPSPPPPAPYMSLLSPTANLLQQNLAAAEKDKDSRASTVSEDFTSSASTSNVSESAQSAPASERGSRAGTHRRMRSAPVSVATAFGERMSVGDRVSAGVEGYWDTLDTYMRPHSTGVGGRMSRTRSMDGAGMNVRFSERI